MPRLPHVSPPDIDNLVKSVTDALNDLLWSDDAQLADLRASKFYAAGGEQPGVEICLRRL